MAILPRPAADPRNHDDHVVDDATAGFLRPEAQFDPNEDRSGSTPQTQAARARFRELVMGPAERFRATLPPPRVVPRAAGRARPPRTCRPRSRATRRPRARRAPPSDEGDHDGEGDLAALRPGAAR